MKIYQTCIIDFFNGCSQKEILKDCENSEYLGFDFDEFEREFIYRLSKETYWEGDGRVLFFPVFTDRDDGRFDYVAIIKQQNNGSTWVGIPDGVRVDAIERNYSMVENTGEYKKWYR
jgi:hypothetical protein